MPGTVQNKAFAGVPIVGGEQVIGVITLESPEENAFPESSVRLLTTLASNLGVALQNARLFEETRRLLEETQQRSAELSVISSVSQGLVSQLDFQAIIDLVGDKMREIFGARDLSIRLYDPETDMLSWPYIIDGGDACRVDPASSARGFTQAHDHDTRQPIVVNSDMAHLEAQFDAYDDPR